jgi:hypothetical protein
MQQFTGIRQYYQYDVCYTEETVHIGQLGKRFLCVPVARGAYRSRPMGDSGRSKQG